MRPSIQPLKARLSHTMFTSSSPSSSLSSFPSLIRLRACIPSVCCTLLVEVVTVWVMGGDGVGGEVVALAAGGGGGGVLTPSLSTVCDVCATFPSAMQVVGMQRWPFSM